tara:strand:+ start:106 stop:267 length:162 start_codon:yes stop_codon:yes gene_type:complete
MKKKIPIYLKKLINEYPKIISGRKNLEKQHQRIFETIKLINKYINDGANSQNK